MSNWTPADLQNWEQSRGTLPSLPHGKPPRPTPKAQGRIRKPKGQNKTEKAYDAHLAMRQRLGEILWYRFEAINLRLGDNCHFKVDFFVMAEDGVFEAHDCKALWKGQTRPHITDDALVKLRTAAEMYPFRVKAVWAEANGEWGEKTF